MISWKATAKGIVSAIPIVNGDGPLDIPTETAAVLNSRLPTLSVLDMVAGLICPLVWPSLLDGGLGIDMYPGCCVWWTDFCKFDGGGCISPTSENKSPKS